MSSLERSVLRGMDAIHIAGAPALKAHVFLSADERPMDAATRVGLGVATVQPARTAGKGKRHAAHSGNSSAAAALHRFMTMHARIDSAPRSNLGSLLRAVPAVLLRLSLGVVALVLMLGALLVGTVLTVGLLAWALLRGKRLAPGAFSATFQRSRGRGRSGTEGLVIDVEARVVPEKETVDAFGVLQRRR
jgi:hypothetical protein